jgi:hypothetical protein
LDRRPEAEEEEEEEKVVELRGVQRGRKHGKVRQSREQRSERHCVNGTSDDDDIIID